MKDKIRKQLKLAENKLYCKHNPDQPCKECMQKISGYVSGISGYVSGISGNVEDILEVLKNEEAKP